MSINADLRLPSAICPLLSQPEEGGRMLLSV